uniref:Uncharacterized protein n=1 Tax=Amphimedon queenslandica TaxID=400682 RepID=A0A1X7SG87_AMPQE
RLLVVAPPLLLQALLKERMAARRGTASSLVEKKRRADERKTLCNELSSTIKVIQEDHVRTKLVKGVHFGAVQLCEILEAIFLHELKDKRGVLWREKVSSEPMADLPEP